MKRTALLRHLPLLLLALCLCACSAAQKQPAQKDDTTPPPTTYKKVYIGDQLVITVPESWAYRESDGVSMKLLPPRALLSSYGDDKGSIDVMLLSNLDDGLKKLLHLSRSEYELSVLPTLQKDFFEYMQQTVTDMALVFFPIKRTTIGNYNATIIQFTLSTPMLNTQETMLFYNTLISVTIDEDIALEFAISNNKFVSNDIIDEASDMMPYAHGEMIYGIRIAREFKKLLN